jgi:hypothetical protein
MSKKDCIKDILVVLENIDIGYPNLYYLEEAIKYLKMLLEELKDKDG